MFHKAGLVRKTAREEESWIRLLFVLVRAACCLSFSLHALSLSVFMLCLSFFFMHCLSLFMLCLSLSLHALSFSLSLSSCSLFLSSRSLSHPFLCIVASPSPPLLFLFLCMAARSAHPRLVLFSPHRRAEEMRGWISKRSHGLFKRWRARWFEISQEEKALMYFHKVSRFVSFFFCLPPPLPCLVAGGPARRGTRHGLHVTRYTPRR